MYYYFLYSTASYDVTRICRRVLFHNFCTHFLPLHCCKQVFSHYLLQDENCLLYALFQWERVDLFQCKLMKLGIVCIRQCDHMKTLPILCHAKCCIYLRALVCVAVKELIMLKLFSLFYFTSWVHILNFNGLGSPVFIVYVALDGDQLCKG